MVWLTSLCCNTYSYIKELQPFVVTGRLRPGLLYSSAGGSGLIFGERLVSGSTISGLSFTSECDLLVPSLPMIIWFSCRIKRGKCSIPLQFCSPFLEEPTCILFLLDI